MASIVYNNIPFDPEFITDDTHNVAFGRFFTAWSQVESAYCAAARILTSLDPSFIGLMLDRARTTDVLGIVFGLAGEIPDETTKARFLEAMNEAKTLSTARNKIAHGGWGYFNSEIARFSYELTPENFVEIMNETQIGKSKREARIFTVKDLEALTERCIKTSASLIDLLPALPDKHSEQQAEVWRLRLEVRDLRLAHAIAQAPPPPPSVA